MKEKQKTKTQLPGKLKTPRDRLAELEQRVGESDKESVKPMGMREELEDSEERLKILFEVAPDAYYLNDLKGRFVDCNRAAEEITGYKREELIGTSFLRAKLLPQRQIPKTAALLARNARGRPTGPDEFILNRKDGNQVAVEVRTFPVKIRGETLVLGIARDITDRKQAEEVLKKAYNDLEIRVEERTAVLAKVNEELRTEITERRKTEEALRESERRCRLLAENVTDVLWTTDMNLRFTYFSPSVVRMLGYRVEEAISKPIEEILTPASLELAKKVLAEEMAVERMEQKDLFRSRTLELELIHQDGPTIWSEAKMTFLRDRDGQAVGIVGVARDISLRKHAEEEIRKLSSAVEQSIDGIAIGDLEPKLTYVNEAFARMHDYSPEEMIGMKVANLHNDDQMEEFKRAINQIKTEGSWVGEIGHIRKDGTPFPTYMSTTLLKDAGGEPTGILAVARDITDQKKLEAQLLWSQKMETVGRLAGGVAHDFNNLLMAIQGHADLGMTEMSPRDPTWTDFQEILKASKRAAKLTHQLLAFSRRQIIEPQVINLNDVLFDTDKMLRRLIGEDIDLVTLPAEDLGSVKVDHGQIEQIIVNLVVNARDAMPEGGRLTLETANVTLDEEFARRHVAVTPGEYVMLAISDTGVGMSEEVTAHLFEPFFTTKEIGKGTGLGLATCYGIVKQSGGNIWVYSEPGKGTTFKIYLPRMEEEVKPLPMREESGGLPKGTETVLLVEDEPSVRNVIARFLREQGYTVHEAENGDQALRMVHKHAGEEIHLLLTDVVMPQMGGKALADHLRSERPNLKVLFFSGYTYDTVLGQGALDSGVAFLQKPFSAAVLARNVREILDRYKSSTSVYPLTSSPPEVL